MKIRDFIKRDIDIDVHDDVSGELYIAFVGPLELTPEGEEHFSDVLDLEIEVEAGDNLATVHIDTPDDSWKRKLRAATDFFWSAAGYCSVTDYETWFQEIE